MAAHDGDSGFRAGQPLRLLEVVDMSVVQRIVFDDQSDGSHDLALVPFARRTARVPPLPERHARPPRGRRRLFLLV
ncbi:hypothetical protein J31TS4_00380 [Paenibacillus sp. J31TS4]|nr:hypothetical protein J31TS4_00380 [Paenibacillus sp. J31TS4]